MATPAVSARAPWWEQPDSLARVVAQLVSAEMRGLRPQGWDRDRPDLLPDQAPDEPPAWAGPAGLADWGADSLELMALSTALVEALDLDDPHSLAQLYRRPSLASWLAAARQGLATHAAHGRGLRLRFRTSGSSGLGAVPRSHAHSLDRLQQEAAHLAQCVASTGPVRRVLSAVPAHHIYGFLTTVLMPGCLGGEAPVPVVDGVGQPPAWLLAQLQPGDVLVSHPAHWAALLRLQPAWPPGVVGLCSTAPCPPELSDALLASGLPRLLHLYGSSETGGIGWRAWPQQAYRLHPFWQRLPADTADGDFGLWRQAASARESGERCEPPDALRWLDEEHFEVLGRRDAVVQVGGVNVNLSAVARTLERHGRVQSAVVRLAGPGDAVPGRLKAFVVPRDDAAGGEPPCPAEALQAVPALDADLLAWCRRHLSPAERPVSVSCGSALPRNAMGKLCDWPVPAEPTLAPQNGGPR